MKDIKLDFIYWSNPAEEKTDNETVLQQRGKETASTTTFAALPPWSLVLEKPPAACLMDQSFWYNNYPCAPMGIPPTLRYKDVLLAGKHLINSTHPGTAVCNDMIMARVPCYISFPKKGNAIVAGILPQIRGRVFVWMEANQKWVRVTKLPRIHARLLTIVRHLATCYRQEKSALKNGTLTKTPVMVGDDSAMSESKKSPAHKATRASPPWPPAAASTPATTIGTQKKRTLLSIEAKKKNKKPSTTRFTLKRRPVVSHPAPCTKTPGTRRTLALAKKKKAPPLQKVAPQQQQLAPFEKYYFGQGTQSNIGKESKLYWDQKAWWQQEKSITIQQSSTPKPNVVTPTTAAHNDSEDDVANTSQETCLSIENKIDSNHPTAVLSTQSESQGIGSKVAIPLVSFCYTSSKRGNQERENSSDTLMAAEKDKPGSLVLQTGLQTENSNFPRGGFDPILPEDATSTDVLLVHHRDFGVKHLGTQSFQSRLYKFLPKFLNGDQGLNFGRKIVKSVEQRGGRFFECTSPVFGTEWQVMEHSDTVPWLITKLLEALEIIDFHQRGDKTATSEFDVFLGAACGHRLVGGNFRFERMAKDRSPIFEAFGDKVLDGLAQEIMEHIALQGGRFFCRQNAEWVIENDRRKLVEAVSRSIREVLVPAKSLDTFESARGRRKRGRSSEETTIAKSQPPSGSKPVRSQGRTTRSPGAARENDCLLNLPNYVDVTERDVLCRPGVEACSHPGNARYQRLIDSFSNEYEEATRHGKAEIANRLIVAVHAWGGRFLARDDATGKWFQAQHQRVIKKTRQALRRISMKNEVEYNSNEDEDPFKSSLIAPGDVVPHRV